MQCKISFPEARVVAIMNPQTQSEVLMAWSGGKDSCMALYEVQQSPAYRIAALLTTITEDFDRISMHGVRRVLLERQAEALSLPLREVFISRGATNEEYETKLLEAVSTFCDRGIDSLVFGDLFLEDIKKYRDEFLARHSLKGIYPIWQRNTGKLVREFIDLGFKAITTCVDAGKLDSSFAGRVIDAEFLSALPSHIDPCGENGEFHTFAFAGPNFSQPVTFSIGEKVCREGFWFCDLVPE